MEVKEREKTKTQLENGNKGREDVKAKRGRTDREEKDCIMSIWGIRDKHLLFY